MKYKNPLFANNNNHEFKIDKNLQQSKFRHETFLQFHLFQNKILISFFFKNRNEDIRILILSFKVLTKLKTTLNTIIQIKLSFFMKILAFLNKLSSNIIAD